MTEWEVLLLVYTGIKYIFNLEEENERTGKSFAK